MAQSTDAATQKPAILQDQEFVVHESWPYRLLRGGSIQLNKVMFASLILLAVWLLWAYVGGDVGCAGTGEARTCSVWLTPTAKFLGAMAVLSFVLSIVMGLLGLVVGKRIVEATSAADEVGARREETASPVDAGEDGRAGPDADGSTDDATGAS